MILLYTLKFDSSPPGKGTAPQKESRLLANHHFSGVTQIFEGVHKLSIRTSTYSHVFWSIFIHIFYHLLKNAKFIGRYTVHLMHPRLSRLQKFGWLGSRNPPKSDRKRRDLPETTLTWMSSGWWFQTFFIFIPVWGRLPFWPIFFKWVETTN